MRSSYRLAHVDDSWEVIVLDRLLRRLVPPSLLSRPNHPPIPTVETTPIEERRRIDQRLSSNAARLAELQALAGLDFLRQQTGGAPLDQ